MSLEPAVVLASWGGAQYLDWWMLVHLIGGLSLGYAARFFGFDLLPAVVAGVVIIVGWEIYEELAHIPEPLSNTILDIVLGLVGFLVAYKYFDIQERQTQTFLLVVLFAMWIGLNLWGWISWKKREVARLSPVEEVVRKE